MDGSCLTPPGYSDHRVFLAQTHWFAEMAKDQYSEVATLVFDEWRKSELLVQHGSRCYLAQIGRKDGVNRAEVAANHDLLAPVLRHIGFLFEIVWVIFSETISA